MNKKTKDGLKEIVGKLDDMKAQIESFKGEIEQVRDEEQEAYDNKSEKWQENEKGEEAQNIIDSLNGAYDRIEDSETSLQDCIDSLESLEL